MHGHAMAQAVRRRSLTAEGWVRSQGQSMWDLWWIKWHWNRFYPEYFGFLLSFSFPRAPLLENVKKKMFSLHLHHKRCTISLKAVVRP
jgi:hypothetical protein